MTDNSWAIQNAFIESYKTWFYASGQILTA
jgi:hypothetical protein